MDNYILASGSKQLHINSLGNEKRDNTHGIFGRKILDESLMGEIMFMLLKAF